MTASESFDLERFVTAQAPVFSAVLAELKSGRKRIAGAAALWTYRLLEGGRPESS